MAAAAITTVVQVEDVVPVGALDPEVIVTPCIYVNRIVRVSAPARAPEPVGAGQ
jgi:3-oxoadipate CoA-transferase, alpha subunit